MEVLQVPVAGGHVVEVGVVGPDDGRPMLYFHSPATSGEELVDATSVAECLNVRQITLRRPSIVCAEPANFVATVTAATGVVIEAL